MANNRISDQYLSEPRAESHAALQVAQAMFKKREGSPDLALVGFRLGLEPSIVKRMFFDVCRHRCIAILARVGQGADGYGVSVVKPKRDRSLKLAKGRRLLRNYQQIWRRVWIARFLGLAHLIRSFSTTYALPFGLSTYIGPTRVMRPIIFPDEEFWGNGRLRCLPGLRPWDPHSRSLRRGALL